LPKNLARTTSLAILSVDERLATPTSLTLPADLDFEDWQELGRRLALVTSASQWWWGDWVNYGEGRWGEKYAAAMESSGYDYQTLANAKWVASEFQFSRRRENLSFSHHLEVAAFSEEEQDRWLDEASAKGWNRNKLRQQLKQNRLAGRHAAVPIGQGVFDVVYADPPWRYEFEESDSREIENQYPTMSLDEIKAYPNEPDIPEEQRVFPAAEDALLFMWTTSPKLEESLQVVEAWGFAYRTCMVWDKERIGMGYYARQQHELLLICKKGSPPIPQIEDRPPSVIRERREEKHSRKPDKFYELIESMWQNARRAEFFRRGIAREGWTCYGNEVLE
jgi:N6-adenosine-specific RNA methylase IME4